MNTQQKQLNPNEVEMLTFKNSVTLYKQWFCLVTRFVLALQVSVLFNDAATYHLVFISFNLLASSRGKERELLTHCCVMKREVPALYKNNPIDKVPAMCQEKKVSQNEQSCILFFFVQLTQIQIQQSCF